MASWYPVAAEHPASIPLLAVFKLGRLCLGRRLRQQESAAPALRLHAGAGAVRPRYRQLLGDPRYRSGAGLVLHAAVLATVLTALLFGAPRSATQTLRS